MDHLLRQMAPITKSGWETIDAEVRRALTPALAARRLIDFVGPHGWTHSATNLGQIAPVSASPHAGVRTSVRRVLPLVELRADFSVPRSELSDSDRGAQRPDLDSLDHAAYRIAVAENCAVFNGWEAAGIAGIIPSSPHETKQLGADAQSYLPAVASCVERLLRSGIEGPYGLALGREQYRLVLETAGHGYLMFERLGRILGGPIVWSPGVEGAVLLSLRGKDFVLDSGQDLCVGYHFHDADAVDLYIEESFSFVVNAPEAAVALSA